MIAALWVRWAQRLRTAKGDVAGDWGLDWPALELRSPRAGSRGGFGLGAGAAARRAANHASGRRGLHDKRTEARSALGQTQRCRRQHLEVRGPARRAVRDTLAVALSGDEVVCAGPTLGMWLSD
jgi:hypothetical protein